MCASLSNWRSLDDSRILFVRISYKKSVYSVRSREVLLHAAFRKAIEAALPVRREGIIA